MWLAVSSADGRGVLEPPIQGKCCYRAPMQGRQTTTASTFQAAHRSPRTRPTPSPTSPTVGRCSVENHCRRRGGRLGDVRAVCSCWQQSASSPGPVAGSWRSCWRRWWTAWIDGWASSNRRNGDRCLRNAAGARVVLTLFTCREDTLVNIITDLLAPCTTRPTAKAPWATPSTSCTSRTT